MQTIEDFCRGNIRVPLPLDGDAYTVSGNAIAAERTRAGSVYYFANRRSPKEAFPGLALDDRMVLYGVTDFLRYFASQLPVTHADVDESAAYMASAHAFGGGLQFPEKLWRRVVGEYNGYPPISIKALPDGSTFWPHEPVVHVSARDGFGELAAHVEANLVGMVANATARATVTRHLLERIREVVRHHNPSWNMDQVDGLARFMVHDFGQRASSTPQEAQIYGRAHLLVFHGTDTFGAGYQAWRMGAKRPTGTSILALAHRIVQGHLSESDAYEAICRASLDSGDVAIASYVADCYDFQNAVKRFLVGIAARKQAVVVARPDSGDFLDNTLLIVREALKAGLYKIDEQGRPSSTYLRFINGDSMSWQKMEQVFDLLDVEGVNPTQWGIFGIGGWLRNLANRDALSSAYKLSACGSYYQRPVIKLSEAVDKMSVPGPANILRHERMDSQPTVFLMDEPAPVFPFASPNKVYFHGAMRSANAFSAHCLESFAAQSERAIRQFDEYGYAKYRYRRRHILSPEILRLQQAERDKHGLK
jgi:nicotinamide phosphoribosyltransferase